MLFRTLRSGSSLMDNDAHIHTHTCRKSGLCTRMHTCTRHAYIVLYTGTCTHTSTQHTQLSSKQINCDIHQGIMLQFTKQSYCHCMHTCECTQIHGHVVIKLRTPLTVFTCITHPYTHTHTQISYISALLHALLLFIITLDF